MINLQTRLDLLVRLGAYLHNSDEALQALIHQTYLHNKWFTEENILHAIEIIRIHYLEEEKLLQWIEPYPIHQNIPKKVALVMPDNVPLEGFHDLLCVFAAGHKAQIKLSEKNKFLIPFFIEKLIDWNEQASEYFEIVEQLAAFDAVIVDENDNTARYFQTYFGKYPNLIRKKRQGIAVLTGRETEEELRSLGHDVFRYFGLGSRSVSKLFVPEGFDFVRLLDVFGEFKEVLDNNKYKNNYDYNYTLLLLNKIPHFTGDCILLTENKILASRIATLHYIYYTDLGTVEEKLLKNSQFECIVSHVKFDGFEAVPFGRVHYPELRDYAKGLDTMEFLLSLE